MAKCLFFFCDFVYLLWRTVMAKYYQWKHCSLCFTIHNDVYKSKGYICKSHHLQKWSQCATKWFQSRAMLCKTKLTNCSSNIKCAYMKVTFILLSRHFSKYQSLLNYSSCMCKSAAFFSTRSILQQKSYCSFRITLLKELVVVFTYSRFRHEQICTRVWYLITWL